MMMLSAHNVQAMFQKFAYASLLRTYNFVYYKIISNT